MNAKLLGAALLVLLNAPASADTTYLYTGGVFDNINIGANLAWGGPNPFFADRAADVATFGTNISGSLTFNFDTTGVTGSICLTPLGGCGGIATTIAGDLIAKSFTAGTHNLFETFAPKFVTFSSGEITGWSFGGSTSCALSLAPTGTCHWETGAGDKFSGIGLSYFPAFWSGPNGSWTQVNAVPGPIAGAGLPGLLLLVGMLWRCRRRFFC